MMNSHYPEIDVHVLAQKLNSNESFVLLDVRENWELGRAKISDGRLQTAPTSRLARDGVVALPGDLQDKEKEILILCHHGVRSAQVANWLITQGWENVFSVRGGIDEYHRQVDTGVGKY